MVPGRILAGPVSMSRVTCTVTRLSATMIWDYIHCRDFILGQTSRIQAAGRTSVISECALQAADVL